MLSVVSIIIINRGFLLFIQFNLIQSQSRFDSLYQIGGFSAGVSPAGLSFLQWLPSGIFRSKLQH